MFLNSDLKLILHLVQTTLSSDIDIVANLNSDTVCLIINSDLDWRLISMLISVPLSLSCYLSLSNIYIKRLVFQHPLHHGVSAVALRISDFHLLLNLFFQRHPFIIIARGGSARLTLPGIC